MNYVGLKRPYPLDEERRRRVMVELARKGLTISELARRIGYNRAHTSSCIQGRYLSRQLEEKIANYLHLPVEYLFPRRTGKQLLELKELEQKHKAGVA